MDTVIWMKTSKPSKAMAPAMVTEGPWVATWSHCTRAATSAASDTTTATMVPARTSMIRLNSDDTSISSERPAQHDQHGQDAQVVDVRHVDRRCGRRGEEAGHFEPPRPAVGTVLADADGRRELDRARR